MADQLEPDRSSNQTPIVKDIGGDPSVCDDNFGDSGEPHGRTKCGQWRLNISWMASVSLLDRRPHLALLLHVLLYDEYP